MADPLSPVRDAQTQLREQFGDLARLWREVREGWADERARAFEQRYVQDLGPSLTRLSAALEQFAEDIRKAERALRDREPPGGPSG